LLLPPPLPLRCPRQRPLAATNVKSIVVFVVSVAAFIVIVSVAVATATIS
jgi:hypothetical protein